MTHQQYFYQHFLRKSKKEPAFPTAEDVVAMPQVQAYLKDTIQTIMDSPLAVANEVRNMVKIYDAGHITTINFLRVVKDIVSGVD